MDRDEIEKAIGKYIITPVGRQLLAGYQVSVIRQESQLKVYPNSIILHCWSEDGGLYHHDMVDCKYYEEKAKLSRGTCNRGLFGEGTYPA